jgi:hypothetical protein
MGFARFVSVPYLVISWLSVAAAGTKPIARPVPGGAERASG